MQIPLLQPTILYKDGNLFFGYNLVSQVYQKHTQKQKVHKTLLTDNLYEHLMMTALHLQR